MAATTPGSCLYEGRVAHERFSPKRHRFSYRAFFCALDLDAIDELARRIPWLSRNRFNLFAFYDSDHIGRDVVQRLLRAEGVTGAVARVVLVTNLRMLGHVFNPVSFFYAFAADGTPLGAIAEVNNTFGDRKCYALTELRGGTFFAVHSKDFYISPFVARDSTLDLRIGLPGDRLVVAMHDLEGAQHVLTASLAMKSVPLTARSLLSMAFRHPLLTLRIVGAIHWEALRLFLKKVPWWRYA